LGVPPKTVRRRELALVCANNPWWTMVDEIRRDAGFDGRDARATIPKYRPGGTGLWPVVLGVPPKTVRRRGLALVCANNPWWTMVDEIRRDAGFDGRDARATHSGK
jgi:hypothetical protein